MPCTPPKSSIQLHRIHCSNAYSNYNNTTDANNTDMTCQKHKSQTKHHSPTSLPRQFQLSCATPVPDTVARHHTHLVGPNQCSSSVVQSIAAPVAAVWSLLRCFDKPQVYKHFVKSCNVIIGDGDVGTLREVHVISGLPAANSTERLEILDDERHVLSFSVVGGEHRLTNYRSVTTLHSAPGGGGTIVVESYNVDVPPGNTNEDTCVFVDTIVKCNLQSLAQIAQRSASCATHRS